MNNEPHAKRRGQLKNGNPPGDLLNVPKCGARTRQLTACLAPAMKNGRCRMHGGLSTGPRTPDGLERSRRARWKHGFYSRWFQEERRTARRRWLDLREAVRRLGLQQTVTLFEGRGPRIRVRRVTEPPAR